MDKKVVFQAAMIAALVAFVAVIGMLIAGTSLPDGVQVQPVEPLPLSELFDAAEQHPGVTLGYFGADTLFVLSYLMVYAGLHVVTSDRSRVFAVIGLCAGGLAAFFDATENAQFIFHALVTQHQVPAGDLAAPSLMLFFTLTNLKWMAAFATLYAFGLIFPRRNWLEWAITALMLIFPVVGILGIANSSLLIVRSLLMAVGMPLFAWYFWQRGREQRTS